MSLLNLPRLFFSVRLPTLFAIFWRKHLSRRSIVGVSANEPSIIIFRLDALGDLVLTTPLFRALKQAHPDSRCTVVVQPAYKSLLATNPHIDEILTLPKVKPHWLPKRAQRLLAAALFWRKHLRKRHFDFAISPRWDVDEHLATFLCVLANASHRVGYTANTSPAKQRLNRGFDAAFDICLPPGPARHEVLRNIAVAQSLGAEGVDGRVEIHISDRDQRHADKRLTSARSGAKLIALGIGAQSRGRRWPLQRWAEVIARLANARDVQPVIVCSSSELGPALELARKLTVDSILVSGAPLREVCAVLRRCELFMGNDSGCAHLAAAMDCPTIVISRHPHNGAPNHFNSPLRFAPQGSRVRILQPATGKEHCTAACSVPHPHCILQVSVDEVVAAAGRMLDASPRVQSTISKRSPTFLQPTDAFRISGDAVLSGPV